MKPTSRFQLLALITLLLALALARPVSAATIVWTNTAGGDWQAATNWSPNTVPGAADTAVISGTGAYAVRFAGSASVGSISFTNSNATLRLVTDNTGSQAFLTVANGFENQGTIELRTGLNGSLVRLTVTTGTLTNAVGGVIRAIEDAVGTRQLFANLDNRGTLQVEGDLLLSGSVANNGTINLPDGKTLTVQDTTTWTHRNGGIIGTGTLSLPSSSTFVLEEDFTPGTFTLNAPNLTVNGPAKLLGPATGEFFIRDWTINAEVVVSGNLRVDGNVKFNSGLSVSAGKTLRLAGSGNTGQSLLTVSNGVVNQGIIELSSEVSAYLDRLTVASGTLTNGPGGVIRSDEGAGGGRQLNANLNNQGTVEVSHDLTYSGNFINNGTVDLPAGKTLTVTGGAMTWTHRNGAVTGTGTLSLPSSSTFVLEQDFTPGTFTLNAPDLTVNGPAKLLGPATGEFSIRDWTINAEVVVSGNLRVDGNVKFNSGLSVSAGKTLRLAGSGNTGQSLLTVSNGVVNQGIIELSSEVSAYLDRLTVASGTLTNGPGGVIRSDEGAGGGRQLNANLNNQGTVEVSHDLTYSGNFINNGTVDLPAGKTLTVTGSAMTWTHRNGAVTGTGTLSLPNSSTFVLEQDFTPGTFTLNAPNLTVNGPAKLLGPATGEFSIRDWTINAEVMVSGDLRVDGVVNFNSPLAVAAGKTLRLAGSGSTGQALLTVANGFMNQGTVELSSEISAYQARLTVITGTLTNATGGVIRALEGAGGQRTLNANLANQGTLLVLAETTLSMNGVLLNASSGVLGGGGTFNLAGATVANNGSVAPGVSPGILSVSGDLPWNSGARFDVEMDGFTAGTNYDRLVLSSPVAFNGTIRAGLINGFFPKKDDAFTVLTYPSRTGTFATLDNPEPQRIAWEVQYGPTSAQLVVLNTAPTLAALANQTVDEQTPLAISASATDQDLPAQVLTYSLDTAPAGMAINPATGQITWTPTEAQGPGEYTVAVRVTDNGTPALGHTNSFSVTVNEVNVAPQLVLPGAQAVSEQTELVFTINGTDADTPANALTYELLSGPPGGTFNPGTREFRWTPTEAQGPGSFPATFRVTDNNPNAVNAQQLSATGIVSIAVNEVNLAPVLTPPSDQTVTEENPLTGVGATATDPDSPANPLTFALVSPPAGMTINAASGAIAWTPTEGQGPFTNTITVVVSDTNPPAVNAKSFSATNTFKVTVNESNRPPVLTMPGPQILTEQTPLTGVSIAATDPDSPTNALSYSLLAPPAGMTINAASGAIAWTPDESQGSNFFTVTVVATDTNPPAINSKAFSVTNTFSVTVNESNRPPVLTLPPSQTVNELVLYSTNSTALDPDLPANALTFALVSGPTGMVVNATGAIIWTPSEFQGPGVYPVQIKVTDANPPAINATSLSVTSSFTLTVGEVNVAPVVGTLGNQSGNPGQTISFTATATDVDLPTNTLSFSLVNPPAGASIVPGSGLFTWRLPAGRANTTNTLAVRVTDAGSPNLSGTNTFTVTVNPILPVLLTPIGYSSGQFRVSVNGSIGPDYILEGGVSLNSLTNLATNTPGSMPFTFTNASAFSNQFYRVRLSP